MIGIGDTIGNLCGTIITAFVPIKTKWRIRDNVGLFLIIIGARMMGVRYRAERVNIDLVAGEKD